MMEVRTGLIIGGVIISQRPEPRFLEAALEIAQLEDNNMPEALTGTPLREVRINYDYRQLQRSNNISQTEWRNHE